MNNFDIDATGLARNTDPETSHIAAALVDVSGLMREIYLAMAKFGDKGCISDEVGDALPHLEVQTYTPRFKQMVDRGMIENTGEKRKGSHNKRLQNVRRVLKPPFIKPAKQRYIHCSLCGSRFPEPPAEPTEQPELFE